MKLRRYVFVVVTVALTTVACKREQAQNHTAAIRNIDASGAYRADKELQAALSPNASIPELQKLTANLKAQVSMLKDREPSSPLVTTYDRIATAYAAYEDMNIQIKRHIDCIVKQDSDSGMRHCDKLYKPEQDEISKRLSAAGITCDPSYGFASNGKCDFATQMAAMDAAATAMYMKTQTPRP